MPESALQRAEQHLQAARAARRRVELDAQRAEVEQLEASCKLLRASRDRDVLECAATAEGLRDIGYVAVDDEELGDALRRARACLAVLSGDRPDIAARLHLAMAQVHARLQPARWERLATSEYVTAARMFIESGEQDDAAATLAALAWTVQLNAGTLRDARESLTEALSLTKDQAMRASMLSQRAQVHLWLSDLDAAEADIEAAWPLAQDGDDRSIAYVAWAAAMIASMRGQRAVVEGWVDRGDRRRGSWADTITGIWYESTVIDALARAGAIDDARSRLDRLRADYDREPTAVGIADVSVRARSGDVCGATEAWQRLRRRPDLEPWDAARFRLLLAAADTGAEAGELAAEAFDMCAQLEEPGVLLTLEPEAAHRMLPVAAQAGSTVAVRLLEAGRAWRIQTLAGFAVCRPDGRIVEVTGRMRRLLMYLAVAGTPLTREELGRRLWPDGPDDAWRRVRLRHLLHRVRTDLAEVVDVANGDRVGLSRETTVDLHLFTREARRARRAPDPVLAVTQARKALRHLAGELLPDEVLDDDWLEVPRSRFARDATWLHTLIAEDEAAEGRTSPALAHARAALHMEATNEQAAALAADLLRRSGRRGEAAQLLADTRQSLAELGLEPGPILRGAAGRLGQR